MRIVGRVTKVGDDLRKEIGGRLDPDDKEAKARLKDHYQEQFFQDD